MERGYAWERRWGCFGAKGGKILQKKIRACRRARFFYGKMREKRETGEMGWRGGIAGGGQRRNGEMAGRGEMERWRKGHFLVRNIQDDKGKCR